MAELCPETAFSGRIWSAHSGLGKKPNEIEAFGIPVCNTRCYTCPSDVAIAHLTFQFTRARFKFCGVCGKIGEMV